MDVDELAFGERSRGQEARAVALTTASGGGAPISDRYASRRPGCGPVREPSTTTSASFRPVFPPTPPSMLIWVVAEASLVSGPGETVTRSPASAAETFSRGGTQLGELALWPPAAYAAGSATSPTSHATPASGGQSRQHSARGDAVGGRGTNP